MADRLTPEQLDEAAVRAIRGIAAYGNPVIGSADYAIVTLCDSHEALRRTLQRVQAWTETAKSDSEIDRNYAPESIVSLAAAQQTIGENSAKRVVAALLRAEDEEA